MWYGSNDILVTPKQLYDLVWWKPMRDIAAEVGLSDVGLAKFFRSRGIPVPPRGWWAKKAVGKASRPPQPPARGPGERGLRAAAPSVAERAAPCAPGARLLCFTPRP